MAALVPALGLKTYRPTCDMIFASDAESANELDHGGFGIVAAVLGIVITMGSIGGPMVQIGNHVAAALVGTFLGIFFAYGFIGPVSAHLENMGGHELKAYLCIKSCLISVVSGYAPPVAAETGRKLLPPHMRPSFIELSDELKQYR